MVFDVPFVAACLATLAVNMHGSHNKRPLSSIDREEGGHSARDNSSIELGGSRRREGKRHQGGRSMLKHVARALADLTCYERIPQQLLALPLHRVCQLFWNVLLLHHEPRPISFHPLAWAWA